MPQTPKPMTALKLLSLLETEHARGRVPPDTFEELASAVDALLGDGNVLFNARSNVMRWEATVTAQSARLDTGIVSRETYRASVDCLQHALSEQARREAEADTLRRQLWAELGAAWSRKDNACTDDFTNEEEHPNA